jgi:hypothetical protein
MFQSSLAFNRKLLTGVNYCKGISKRKLINIKVLFFVSDRKFACLSGNFHAYRMDRGRFAGVGGMPFMPTIGGT